MTIRPTSITSRLFALLSILFVSLVSSQALAANVVVTPGTGTLSAAIAAGSSGDAFFLQSGTYTENSSITVSGKAISIIGTGKATTYIKFNNSDGFNFDISGVSRVVNIGGFTIATDQFVQGTAIALSGPPTTNAGSTIHDIEFNSPSSNGYWHTGIRLESAKNTLITNCFYQGYFTEQAVSSARFVDIRTSSSIKISNSVSMGTDTAVIVWFGASIDITVVDSSFSYSQVGVNFNFGSEVYGTGYTVVNSTFRSIHAGGIEVGRAINTRISNNTIELDKSGATGIRCLDKSIDVGIVNNRISAQATNELGPVSQTVGIEAGMRGGSIANNYIAGAGGSTMMHGILVGVPVSGENRLSIIGNLIEYTGTTGINLSTGSSRIIVSSNILNSTVGGIQNLATNFLVNNNMVY